MISLAPEQLARALGLGSFATPVTGLSIDSRSIKSGDVFVALRGATFDGHDFVGEAFAAGAAAAIVEREAAPRVRRMLSDAGWGRAKSVYEVDDTLRALGALARAVRRQSAAVVFGVTGSVGKTSTKDLLRAALGSVWRVVATTANQNNEIGVPLTLLKIESGTEAVVLEMGMRGLGQIAELTALAEPDVGLITNIHPVHLELLGNLGSIAQAKVELLSGLREGGVAVVPAECEVLRPYLESVERRVVRFATGHPESDADVVGWIERVPGGAAKVLRLRWPQGEVSVETTPLPGHGVENAVAALAACYAAGLPVDRCAEGIGQVEFSAGRGQLIALPGLWVIDDTYNANPAAVKAAIDHLVSVAAEKRGRAVAILGDMLELGPGSRDFHREVGEYAAEKGVAALWGVGPQSAVTVEGFRQRCSGGGGLESGACAGHVASAGETSAIVEALLTGDVVLLKASRAIGLDRVVRRLVEQAGTHTKEKR